MTVPINSNPVGSGILHQHSAAIYISSSQSPVTVFNLKRTSRAQKAEILVGTFTTFFGDLKFLDVVAWPPAPAYTRRFGKSGNAPTSHDSTIVHTIMSIGITQVLFHMLLSVFVVVQIGEIRVFQEDAISERERAVVSANLAT